MPTRPAVEPVEGRGIAVLLRAHGRAPNRFAGPVKPSHWRHGVGELCSARATNGEGEMRSGGINWLAVIVAAIVIYAIGFVIYGVLIPEDRLMAMMQTDE